MIPAEVAVEIEKVRSDRRSGAAEILTDALAVFESLRAGDERIVRAICRALAAAQPEMAPLFNLARAVEITARNAKEARLAARRFVVAAQEAQKRAIENAARIISPHRTVLTHSRSSTVRASLLLRAGQGPLRVMVTESMPLGEGRVLATELSDLGVDAECIPDAMMRAKMKDCQAFVCGGDEVSRAGVRNKIGTREIARVAQDFGIPSYAIADSAKLVTVPLAAPRASSLYDLTPLDLFAAIVTETGALSPSEIVLALSGLEKTRRGPD